jgi:hypothetical protein
MRLIATPEFTDASRLRTAGMIAAGSPVVLMSSVRVPFSSCFTGAKNSGRDGASRPFCRSLPTTPTIVRQNDVESGYRSNATRFPIGSSFAKNFFASASLMSTTG